MIKHQSLFQEVFFKALYFIAMLIPTAISIFLAIEIKRITGTVDGNEPQIVCFEENICAIEVYEKWYRIDGVILMDETIPEEYRLNDLIEESEATQLLRYNNTD